MCHRKFDVIVPDTGLEWTPGESNIVSFHRTGIRFWSECYGKPSDRSGSCVWDCQVNLKSCCTAVGQSCRPGFPQGSVCSLQIVRLELGRIGSVCSRVGRVSRLPKMCPVSSAVHIRAIICKTWPLRKRRLFGSPHEFSMNRELHPLNSQIWIKVVRFTSAMLVGIGTSSYDLFCFLRIQGCTRHSLVVSLSS